ncbi:MAG: gamma-glutamyl-gamma-aminobutyrate hydrolase family protein [Planctomycetota bacterium]
MSAPLIAVNGLYHAEDPMLRLRQRYFDAVRRAGGVPVAVAPHVGPGDPETEVDALLGRVDGLLLTGGDDFVTEPLGLGATHASAVVTEPAKQSHDLALARAALRRGLPVLGICYGMQCLGLAAGATLWQDLPSQRAGEIPHADGAVHPVRAKEGTKLAAIVGLGPVEVVSRHHQALRAVPPPWIVSCVDDEDLVEAIEHPGATFALGVQWHPELSPGEPPHEALLRALVSAAGQRQDTR